MQCITMKTNRKSGRMPRFSRWACLSLSALLSTPLTSQLTDLCIQERFAELMKEPAPEFHVRPRNKDQQAVTPLYAQQGQLYPHQQTDMRLHTAGDPGAITLHMGTHGAIENIAFADEWDDEAEAAEVDEPEQEQGMQVDEPFKAEEEVGEMVKESKASALAVQNQQQPAQMQAQAQEAGRKPLSGNNGQMPQPQQQPRVRVLAALPSQSAPAAISSFGRVVA